MPRSTQAASGWDKACRAVVACLRDGALLSDEQLAALADRHRHDEDRRKVLQGCVRAGIATPAQAASAYLGAGA